MDYPNSNDLYQGKFTDGDPIAGIAPSVDSAGHMNALYDELIAVIQSGGLTPNNQITNQMALSIQQQLYSQRIFTASGNANDLILTSTVGQPPILTLRNDDQFKVRIASTNTGLMTLKLDDQSVLPIANISSANQLFAGTVATFTYLDGALFLTEQINPKTGNDISDIGKLIVDTTDVVTTKELLLDGATLNRADFPVFWSKVQATSNLMDQATKDAEPETYAGFYGDGDGSTTFTLPDLRGEFIRMADQGRGVDDDSNFGRWQDYATARPKTTDQKKLLGDGSVIDALSEASNPSYAGFSRVTKVGESRTAADANTGHSGKETDIVNTVAGDKETRPRNIAYYAKTRV